MAPSRPRKHERDTPTSSASELSPKRACAVQTPVLGGATPPPPYSGLTTPTSQAWGGPPAPDALLVLGTQLHVGLSEMKAEIRSEMQAIEEKRMQAEIAMLQKFEENKIETAKKTEISHALLTQNLLKMCEDLASRVTSPRGAGPEGTSLSKTQVQSMEMAMEGKMSAWEGRIGEFLENLSKSHAADFEKIARTMGQMHTGMEEKHAQLRKEIVYSQNGLQGAIAESVKPHCCKGQRFG